MPALSVETPTGPFSLFEEEGAIVRASWLDAEAQPTALLDEAADQVRAYFAGQLEQFDLPLAPKGSETQLRFWGALQEIAFGETRTYGEIASDLGLSAQAAGQLCGANPIPLIIPCHRVLGANSLGGFSAPGGIETKIALLKHERAAGLLI